MDNPEAETERSSLSEVPYREPDPKKLKMSTTTTEDEAEFSAAAAASCTETRKPRYKRRKIAIFFAYCGVGYQGMQKNPGAKTIEGELEEALFRSGAVPESDRGKPRMYDWARSARTDKGVSAVGQVVSGRFYVDPPGLVDRLNSNLPDQIQIFGYKRVTPSFSAKKFCDRRRYVYLIPVFALNPSSHRDREAVMASLGSGQEFAKCLECSERGRKVVGVMGKGSAESKSVKVQPDISSNDLDAAGTDIKDETMISKVEVDKGGSNGNPEILGSTDASAQSMNEDNSDSGFKPEEIEPKSNVVVSVMQDEDRDLNMRSLKESATPVEEEKINGEGKDMTNGNFCYGEEEKKRFNRILNHYVGSHNFHNFTTRTKAEDPSARRYIVSFNANTIVNLDGIDFVKCEVVGQSFMLHQIRKMIGLAVAIMRNSAPESLIETAFEKDVNINVPTAPEVGLYLDECFFTSYNNKWKDSHEELSMKPYKDEAEEFKTKHIYSHIASAECKDGAVALWLHSLNHRNYPDLQVADTGHTAEQELGVCKNGEASDEKIQEEKVPLIENIAGTLALRVLGDGTGKFLSFTKFTEEPSIPICENAIQHFGKPRFPSSLNRIS